MSGAVMLYGGPGLPWDVASPDVKRFRRWLGIWLLTVVAIGGAIPWIVLPEVERAEQEKLPPQLARILLEKPKPPPPPPPPKPEEKPEVKKEEPKPVEKKPEKKIVKKPEPKPQPTLAEAKEKAEVSGLLAFKDAFADMRDAVDVSKLTDTGKIQQGAGEAASIDRSLLTSKHSTRSAGVNVAALSSDTGGVALSGRATTKVEAPKSAQGGTSRVKRVKKAIDGRERSIEEIRRVFDSNKGAIFAIYNRALRSDPTLQGKVLLELVIAPNGQVTGVKVVDSELHNESLVAKIINRIRLFNFGQRDVATTKINYPVHFLPT